MKYELSVLTESNQRISWETTHPQTAHKWFRFTFGTLREPSIEALKDAPCRFRYGSNKRTILVDALTANAVLACYSALNELNQAKFARMVAGSPAQFRKVVDFCWKHIKIG